MLFSQACRRILVPSFLALLHAFPVAAASTVDRNEYDSWEDLQEAMIEKSIMRQWIPMRDGVRPTEVYSAFVENGYAIVFQNERGRYWSEGEHEYLARAGEDGYDTIDWIAKQEWSNGKVGPYREQGNIYRGGALQLLFPAWFHDYVYYSGAGDMRPQ